MRRKPQEGYESYLTQRVANKFPPWHEIRMNPDSNGQALINAWSMSLDKVTSDLHRERRNLYIGTAETLVRRDAYRTEVPQLLKVRPSTSVNRTVNSGFVDKGIAHRNVPLTWEVTEGNFHKTDALYGNGSINLTPGAAGSGEFYQDVESDYNEGESYTASVYFKGAGTDETNNGFIHLAATGWDMDQTATTLFDGATSGSWERETVTIQLTGEAHTIQMKCGFTPTGEVEGLFNAPQLEPGTEATEWKPSAADIGEAPFRVTVSGPTGETQEQYELRYVDQIGLFEEAMPDRIVATLGSTGEAVTDLTAPVLYEWDGSFWETNFRLSGEYIERYNSSIDSEVINEYQIADRYPDNLAGTGEYGYVVAEEGDLTRTLEALTVWRNRIYLIATETKTGVTRRVLKVIRARGIDEQLEVVHDVLVGMDTGTVSGVGFIDGRMDQLAIEMDDTTIWTLQMYYDSFWYDTTRKQILVRQPYTDYTFKIVEL